MTSIQHPVPVPRTLLSAVLGLLTEAKSFTPLHHEAVALIGDLTDMLEHAESPEGHGSIAAELLEAIGLACKVELPTEPTLHSLRRAREALAGLAVEAKIIDLPRAVTPDVRRDIAADVSRQLEQAHGVDLVFYVDGQEVQRGRWPATPSVNDLVRLGNGTIRRRVLGVCHEASCVSVYVDRRPADD